MAQCRIVSGAACAIAFPVLSAFAYALAFFALGFFSAGLSSAFAFAALGFSAFFSGAFAALGFSAGASALGFAARGFFAGAAASLRLFSYRLRSLSALWLQELSLVLARCCSMRHTSFC